MLLERVISGGQSGADQAGLRAARLAGIPTGGWAPKRWMTEDGPAPWLADFGLVECPDPGYPARTERNVSDAGMTIFFGDKGAGYGATFWAATERDRPFWHISGPDRRTPGDVAAVLAAHYPGLRILNVAGNRESKSPGVGAWVEAYMAEVFRILREDRP